MATFENLPEEIIDRISAYLVDHHSTTNNETLVANLSLVSKKLHRIAEPHLYHTIRLKFDTVDTFVMPDWYCLLSTFEKKPQLAQYVRHLSARRVEASSLGHNIGNNIQKPINPRFANKGPGIGDFSGEKLDNLFDICLASLLSNTVNVSQLDLSEYLWMKDSDEFWAFVDIVTTRMSLLRSLKVGLHECQPIPWTDGTDLTFSNGSLEELSFTNGSLLSPAGNSFWQSIPTNTVKDLTLCNLHGVPDSIARIISQAFTTLRSLTVSLDSDNLDRQFGGLYAVTGCLVGLEHVFPKPSF